MMHMAHAHGGAALTSASLPPQGLSPAAIGRGRAAAGLTSLVGAASFPWMRRRLGTGGAGRAGVLLQLFALTPAVASLWWGGGGRGAVALAPLMVGVVVSRAGLWLFDLSVSQIFQETVPPAGTCRGVARAAPSSRPTQPAHGVGWPAAQAPSDHRVCLAPQTAAQSARRSRPGTRAPRASRTSARWRCPARPSSECTSSPPLPPPPSRRRYSSLTSAGSAPRSSH